MPGTRPDSRFLLPTGWARRVPSVVVHAISLTHVSLTVARSRVSEGTHGNSRLQIDVDRLRQETSPSCCPLPMLLSPLSRLACLGGGTLFPPPSTIPPRLRRSHGDS